MSALTLSNVVVALLSLLQVAVVARLLGPEPYGQAALVMSFPLLLLSFVDARSSVMAVRYLTRFTVEERHREALAMCKLSYVVDMGMAIVAFAIVLGTSGWAARTIVGSPETRTLLVMFTISFLPRALKGPSRAILSVAGRFRMMASVEAAFAVLRVGLVIGLVSSGWGIVGLVMGTAIATAALGISLAAIALRQAKGMWGETWITASWEPLKGRWKGIIRFVALTDFYELLGLFSKQLDLVLLGAIRGPAEAGYYRVAKQAAGAVGFLVGPLQSVTYPRLSALVDAQRIADLRALVRRLALTGVLLAAAVAGGAAFLPWVVPAVMGEAFSPATLGAIALAVGSASWAAFFWLRPLYMAIGRIGSWTKIMTTMIIVLVAGYAVVVPLWGFRGLAVWLATVQATGHIVAAMMLKRKPLEEEVRIG